MSWESTATALIEALNRHSTALEGFVKQTGKAGAAGTAAADKTTKASAETTAAPKKKKITTETVTEKFTGFLKAGGAGEQAERIATVKKINKHFGVAKMTDADPTVWPQAFAVLDRVIAGEDVDDIIAELSGDEGDEGDEDEGSIV